MLESILRAPVLFFNRNPIGKSDMKLLNEYVLLTHLVPDDIFIFENQQEKYQTHELWTLVKGKLDIN